MELFRDPSLRFFRCFGTPEIDFFEGTFNFRCRSSSPFQEFMIFLGEIKANDLDDMLTRHGLELLSFPE
uniref:Uncharacterized protein n=1 Tax=Megaselia scalaris TaxID=36166 RepID=T1GLY9_MEGSC